jgi:hypothetical protein
MTLRGIDGCNEGWIIARAREQFAEVTFELVERVSSVFATDRIVAIDIPMVFQTRDREHVTRKRDGCYAHSIVSTSI